MRSERVPLLDLVDIVGGGTPSRSEPRYWDGDIPWATVKDLDEKFISSTTENITRDGLENSSATLLPAGTVVLATRIAPGRAALANIDVAINQDLKGLITGDRIDPAYLLWFMSSVAPQLASRSSGSTVQGVTLETLARTRVPVPDIQEQRRIAALLNLADSIRLKRHERLRLLGQLEVSAFVKMFGDPVTNERGWPTSALGDIADVDRGRFTPRPRNDPQYYGGTHPFIQTGDIARASGMLTAWKQTLNEKGTTVSRKFPKGSIAIAIAANIGDTAIVDFEFYCPDSVVGIVAKRGVEPGFLEMCLRFLRPNLIARAPMTAQRNINLAALRPLRLILPPLSLQRGFSAIREASTAAVDRIQAADKQLECLVKSIVQDVFAGV